MFEIFISIMALLRILSLNCHGFNAGIEQYLKRVISKVDVILLQETWLSDARRICFIS